MSVPLCDRKKISVLFAAAVRSFRVNDSYELRRFAAVCELAFYYLENSGAVAKPDKKSGIGYIVKYINENLFAEHSLASPAQAVCFSPNYFVCKFRSEFGMSPSNT